MAFFRVFSRILFFKMGNQVIGYFKEKTTHIQKAFFYILVLTICLGLVVCFLNCLKIKKMYTEMIKKKTVLQVAFTIIDRKKLTFPVNFLLVLIPLHICIQYAVSKIKNWMFFFAYF